MKLYLYLIFTLLIIPLIVQAQTLTPIENELKVRFAASLGENVTVNLTRFLGEGNYSYTPSDNVIITIKDGIAELKAKPNWKGVEEITFTTIQLTNKNIISFKIPQEIVEKKIEHEIELSNKINETYFKIVKDIKPEQIKEILTNYQKDNLDIKINKELEISINTEARPKVLMKLLTLAPTQIKTTPQKFQINFRIILILFVIVALPTLFYYSKSYIVKIKTKIKYKKEKEIKKRKLIYKINKINLESKDALRELQYLTYEFFIIFFKISKNDTLFELESTLNKGEITGYLKQEILLLFEKIPKITQKDMPKTLETLKFILKKL